jgi:uncharacterized membrane protein YphA (DoxX/SURF4 family)
MIPNHLIAAEAILRVLLGILFFAQGYDKVFRLTVKGVIRTFQYPLQLKILPRFVLVASAYYTSYIELLGGFFLVLGCLKFLTLYLLGIDLVIVVTAFSIMNPVWNMKHLFPRIGMLVTLLLMPPTWSVMSVDYWWSVIHFLQHITN